MKKQLLLIIGLLLSFSSISQAQKIASGALENLEGKFKFQIVFDYSGVKIGKTDKTIDDLLAGKESFAKDKEKEERYFIGSVEDDTKALALVSKDMENPDAIITIALTSMKDDLEKPRFKAIIADPSGSELVTIEGIEEEDFNDAGHSLGGFLHKLLKKAKKN